MAVYTLHTHLMRHLNVSSVFSETTTKIIKKTGKDRKKMILVKIRNGDACLMKKTKKLLGKIVLSEFAWCNKDNCTQLS